MRTTPGKLIGENGPKSQLQDSFTRITAPERDLTTMPNTMAVFAHPDDEVIALGGRLGRFHTAYFVHVTDGAPRDEHDRRALGFLSLQDYRCARAEELRRALSTAGLGNVSRECLGIPDQEASLQLWQLTWRLYRMLEKRQPEAIITHPYEGGHPDHDACAFAVHHAVTLWKRNNHRGPLIVEGAFYHMGPEGIATGSFLPYPRSTQETVYPLLPEERLRKQALLACFTTQHRPLRYFRVECERFRIAPEYEFQRPPHPAPVFYDQYAWGMTSQRFCELTQDTENLLERYMAASCL
jgi:LmbE family N-acetylglucosaminyl deacetylase